MLIELIMITIMTLVGATKRAKMPVFGQLTLTGDKAVEWVKHESKIQARKVWMGAGALFDEYNLPEWAIEKGIVALIFPIDEYQNPLLVTQKSILKVLESNCCEWERAGSATNVLKVKMGQVLEIVFEENEPTFEFLRPKNAKQFDPYKVVVS
jgi:hypothetical protein|tara:strand:- start:12 stop:470 length:459 start_codon:yes stop_codon:yes gene_type:complete